MVSRTFDRRNATKLVLIGASVITIGALVGYALLNEAPVPLDTDHAHGHAHVHAHAHDHDHDHDHEYFHAGSRREHHCIHDKMVHPEIVRGPMRSNSGLGPEIDDTLVSDAISRRATEVTDIAGAIQHVEPWYGLQDADTQYTEAICQNASVHNPANTASAIRIQLVDGGVSTLSDAHQTYLSSTLMPAVQAYFEATLQVAALDTDSSFLKCAGTGAVGDVNMSSFCAGTGYQNKDFVLFYAGSDSPTCQGSTSTLAYAATLETMDCDRPVVGYIHFCKEQLKSTDTSSTEHTLQFKTALHEVIHTLGFSSRMYAYYRNTVSPWDARTARNGFGKPDAGTSTITLDVTDETGAYKNHSIHTTASDYFVASGTDDALGHTVSFFKSNMASLFEKATAQFSCDTRVEVENQGGGGSWGSHWEKRIFGNELMTSTVGVGSSPLSDVTLGLLSDTGFYKVHSYTATYSTNAADLGQLRSGAEPNKWLKSAGCAAITEKCIDSSGEPHNVTVGDTPWCNAKKTDSLVGAQCTYDYLAIGYCNRATQAESFPAQNYQYFGDTSYGEMPASDYCPYVVPFAQTSHTTCTDTLGNTEPMKRSGQIYGQDSRCFTSTLADTARNPFDNGVPTAGCYSTECISTTEIAVSATFEEKTYVMSCSTKGATKSLPGISGMLTCPDIATTACPTAGSFSSLESMTVATDPASEARTLLPAFASSEVKYRVLALSTDASVKLKVVSTSTASNVTIKSNSATNTAGKNWEHVVALVAGKNEIEIVVQAGTPAVSKTYTVTILKSMGSTKGLYFKWTIGIVFSTFKVATFKTEVCNLLGLATASCKKQIVINLVTAGVRRANIVVVKFSIVSDGTAYDTATLDATLTEFYQNKASSMYMDATTYTYLSKTLSVKSGPLVACKSTCDAASCDPITGCCGECSSDDDDLLSKLTSGFVFYAIIAVAALIVLCVCFCLIKCLCCEKTVAKTTKDKSAFVPNRGARTRTRENSTAGLTDNHSRLANQAGNHQVPVRVAKRSEVQNQDSDTEPDSQSESDEENKNHVKV